MSLIEAHFFSKSIGMQSRMMVLMPDAGPGPFPVFYLLHGLSDDCSIWLRRTSIERYLGAGRPGASVPLMVVMPETGRGWYVNAAKQPGRRYEDHIMEDVMGYVERVFPARTDRAGRVIGGLSMGGFGAVKLGLSHPDKFCSITSLSGAIMTPLHNYKKRSNDPPELKEEFETILGENWHGGPNDCAALAKNCPKELRPVLRLDCGTGDFLLEQNRDYHRILDEVGYSHEYAEYPGEHNWDYWDVHIQDALAFHCRNLGIGVSGVR
jgi:putative tributyrin esterase